MGKLSLRLPTLTDRVYSVSACTNADTVCAMGMDVVFTKPFWSPSGTPAGKPFRGAHVSPRPAFHAPMFVQPLSWVTLNPQGFWFGTSKLWLTTGISAARAAEVR